MILLEKQRRKEGRALREKISPHSLCAQGEEENRKGWREMERPPMQKDPPWRGQSHTEFTRTQEFEEQKIETQKVYQQNFIERKKSQNKKQLKQRTYQQTDLSTKSGEAEDRSTQEGGLHVKTKSPKQLYRLAGRSRLFLC